MRFTIMSIMWSTTPPPPHTHTHHLQGQTYLLSAKGHKILSLHKKSTSTHILKDFKNAPPAYRNANLCRKLDIFIM